MGQRLNVLRKPGPFTMLGLICLVLGAELGAGDSGGGRRRLGVKDLKPAYDRDEHSCFSRPVALRCDRDHIYVVDAEECEIRQFSRSGLWVKTIGRRGQGPGEFDHPSDCDFHGDKIYVSDMFNRRIQVLDESGRYAGGFRVRIVPDRIRVTDESKVIVTHLPLGTSPAEKILHCFRADGTLSWRAVDSSFSGDSVLDTFRNLVVLDKGDAGEAFVFRKSGERAIVRLDGQGRALDTIKVEDAYPLPKILLPLQGRKKSLHGFCWDADYESGSFYMLAPEHIQERDLGPGRNVYIVSREGRLSGVIELPCPVKKISGDGDRIYAVDTENFLRIFQVIR